MLTRSNAACVSRPTGVGVCSEGPRAAQRSEDLSECVPRSTAQTRRYMYVTRGATPPLPLVFEGRPPGVAARFASPHPSSSIGASTHPPRTRVLGSDPVRCGSSAITAHTLHTAASHAVPAGTSAGSPHRRQSRRTVPAPPALYAFSFARSALPATGGRTAAAGRAVPATASPAHAQQTPCAFSVRLVALSPQRPHHKWASPRA